jgi:hypothetical protein
MPKYDALIKAHSKDYMKLKLVIDSIKYLNPQPENIILISPDGFVPAEYMEDKRIKSYTDFQIFPNCDRNRLRYRPNWCYASTMAVFQDVTPNDFFLDIQCDNFFVKEINLFDENDKPIFFVSPQCRHYYQPYFDYNKAMFGEGRRMGTEWGIGWEDSLIIGWMMYNKTIAKEILALYGGIDKFYDKACAVINDTCHPSEQDLFPNWVLPKHPDMYVIKKNVQIRVDGKDYPGEFTVEEIERLIDIAKTNPECPDVVALACHTWKMEYPIS